VSYELLPMDGWNLDTYEHGRYQTHPSARCASRVPPVHGDKISSHQPVGWVLLVHGALGLPTEHQYNRLRCYDDTGAIHAFRQLLNSLTSTYRVQTVVQSSENIGLAHRCNMTVFLRPADTEAAHLCRARTEVIRVASE